MEGEAREYRIDFALLEFWLPRATADAGLRNFSFARRLVQEKLASGVRDGDRYTIVNAAGLAARIEVAAASRVIPPFRSGLEQQACAGIYAEYVLSIALAEATFGIPARARALKVEALHHPKNAETEVLAMWVDAVLAPEDRELVSSAFAPTSDRGSLDRAVVAYRGCPPIAETLAADDQHRDDLEALTTRANDLEIAQRLGLTDAASSAKRHRLTKREREVYGLMVDGLSNRAIAQRLLITEPTAKLHVRHILGKLSARSRAEAVAKWA